MTQIQFRALYRQFLFRMVDLELLSAHAQGDLSKLLGQFAALLIFLSSAFALMGMGFGNNRMSHAELLIAAWGPEHSIIATTMVVVGVFAVLSWDSTFPDQRDVMVLAPLPVRGPTLFLAKVAASGTALSLTVLTLHALAGIVWPFALMPATSTILDVFFSLDFYHPLLAYWVTMFAAGTFLFCSVLAVQGLAAQLLPRRRFLRLSAFLQMAAFCLFLSVYFLAPSLATPQALAAPANQHALAWLPSYWFLGFFQQWNGSMHPAMAPLARRAWIGLAISILSACAAYLLSYLRSLRKIVEEPDIQPGVRGIRWLPPFGNALQTAIVQFSIRTLLRSRQHRITLAFYVGLGLSIVVTLLHGGLERHARGMNPSEARLLFSSFVLFCVWITGLRVVFAMPLALRANWIFRTTQVRSTHAYLVAIRRPLFLMGVAPACLASAVLFLSIWPWRLALGHLTVLALWGIILAYLGLHQFQKIPFTCSYLPGKSGVHLAFLGAVGLLTLVARGVEFEYAALQDPLAYVEMLGLLAAAALVARLRTLASANSDEAIVQFEEGEPPAVLELGLHRDGVMPIEPSSP